MRRFDHPRAARLLSAADFAALKPRSRRLGSRHFIAEFARNDLDTARLGQAVSRRVSKLAVDRNRIKRLVRESFRHARARLPSIDLLLIARSSAATAAAKAVREDLELLWRKLTHAASRDVEASADPMPPRG